jgi:hypothetical protein
VAEAMAQLDFSTLYFNVGQVFTPGSPINERDLFAGRIEQLGKITVRTPLRILTEKPYVIPNFARHLKEFSEPIRGKIVERVGAARRLRYRFVSPIMRPYIVMRGFSEKMLNRQMLKKIENA